VIKRLWIIAAVLVVLGILLTLRSQPAIFSGQTVPVPVDELLRLNPE
jgi:hypothetical protein